MKHAFKKICFLVLVVLFFFAIGIEKANAFQNDTISKPETEKTVEKKDDIKKESTQAEKDEEEATDRILVVSEETIQIVSISFFLIMLILIIAFFSHIRAKDQYVGFQSIKYIGLVLMFPGICILALVGGGNLISGSTLAALLGTIAGYVLSRERDDDSNSKNNNEIIKKNEALKVSEGKLQKEIESLKKQLSEKE